MANTTALVTKTTNFYEEAKNLFKKMKVIRTEKIENLNKKIIVNKHINNNILNSNNPLLNRQHRTISHSPSNTFYE